MNNYNSSIGQPQDGFGRTSHNAHANLTQIPATHMYNGPSVNIMPGFMVIEGGNDGPLYVNPRNPRLATNTKRQSGYICSSCGKGIMLLDISCVKNG